MFQSTINWSLNKGDSLRVSFSFLFCYRFTFVLLSFTISAPELQSSGPNQCEQVIIHFIFPHTPFIYIHSELRIFHIAYHSFFRLPRIWAAISSYFTSFFPSKVIFHNFPFYLFSVCCCNYKFQAECRQRFDDAQCFLIE